MKNKFIKLIPAVLLLCTGYAFQSCNCDDLTASDTEWAKEPGDPQLIGLVTTIGGKPVQNAVIDVVIDNDIHETRTDAQGYYHLTGLKAGVYSATCSVSDSDYETRNADVYLENDKITVWNVILIVPHLSTIEMKAGEDFVETIPLPDIIAQTTEGLSSSPVQTATYAIPTEAFPEGEVFESVTYYDYKDINKSHRAATRVPSGYTKLDQQIVVNVEISTQSGNMLANVPFTVVSDGLEAPLAVYHDGLPVDYTVKEQNGLFHIEFTTDVLGTTEYFYNVYKTKPSRFVETLDFHPNEFKGRLEVLESNFTYNSGSKIVYSGSYLDHYICILEGVTNIERKIQHLVLNKFVPAGEKLLLEGYQENEEYKYSCGSKVVDITHYGDIFLRTLDRRHTGGSN